MSPYTTPMVVSVSGSNARAEGRGSGGAVFGAGSAASAMVGPSGPQRKIRRPVGQTQLNHANALKAREDVTPDIPMIFRFDRAHRSVNGPRHKDYTVRDV